MTLLTLLNTFSTGGVSPPAVSTPVETAWHTAAASKTLAMSWSAGDRIIIFAVTAGQGATIATPTATGLTFTPLGTAVTDPLSAWGHKWVAQAASGGGGNITLTNSGDTALPWGAVGYVATGASAVASLKNDSNAASTTSLTTTSDNSAVVMVVARPRDPIFTLDRSTLVAGVDKPDASNTGVLPETARTTDNTAILTLSIPGTIYENRELYGRIIVTAPNCIIRNVHVRGAPGGPGVASVPMIKCTDAAVSNLKIIDCTIAPDTEHKNWGNAIEGHDFEALRCNIYHTVDGPNIFNTNHGGVDYATNTTIKQCWIHDLAWWSASAGGDVHPTDVMTHNDCIQHQGGTGTQVIGNNLSAYYARDYAHWKVTGDPYTEPYTGVTQGTLPDGGPFQPIPDRGSGTEATGRYNWLSICAFMVNDNQRDSYNLTFTDNWVSGGSIPVNAGGVSRTAPNNLGDFLRNRFSRDAGQQVSGGNTTYTINIDGTYAGFVNYAPGGADKNYYEDNLAEVTVRTNG